MIYYDLYLSDIILTAEFLDAERSLDYYIKTFLSVITL